MTLWATLIGIASYGLVGQPAPNLLPNPDLASGWMFPEGWVAQGGAGGRVDWMASADNAVSALVLRKEGDRDWLGVGTSSRVPCEPGQTLTVAAWVRTNAGEHGADQLYVRFYDAGTRFVGQDGPIVPGACDAWTRISGVVTAPPGATSCDVSLQLRNADSEVAITHLGLAAGDVKDLSSEAPAEGALSPVRLPRVNWIDSDEDGLSDAVEDVLGTDPDTADPLRRASRPRSTSFQTPTGYLAENDVKSDVVIVAGNAQSAIESWSIMGYEPHVMYGFRAGDDYVAQYPGEVQRDAAGNPLTCGPGSYYMVPTERRREMARQYFREAAERGALAACPEEAEFMGPAGYSEAFKALYAEEYGQPWEDPTSSVDARYRTWRLMTELQHQLLDACWDGAKEANPASELFLLSHSPVNYAQWGIVSPHWDMISTGRADGLVAQVWTGTSRTANRLRGEVRERTFETGYLEYASAFGLARGTGAELWFLMDPLEDNPDRTMEDYLENYRRTLCASLFFPEVDKFEVMPWPTRIFGRVPDEFATVVCTVVGALADIQNQPESSHTPERVPLATFVADSLQMQRRDPAASDFDSFFGLCLPFVADGVPMSVAQLERAADPAYLAPYDTLLLSYDAMKPFDPAINRGIAEWVRGGGELVVFGGRDAYNDLDAWWREAGYASPHEQLLAELGLQAKVAPPPPAETDANPILAESDRIGPSDDNGAELEFDLTEVARESGEVYLRFEDSKKGDGWGALLNALEVRGAREGRPVTYTVTPGTDGEKEFLFVPGGTSLRPGMRFADAHDFFVYRFEVDAGTRVVARMTVQNQYRVSASGSAVATREFAGGPLARPLAAPVTIPFTLYDPAGADAAVDDEGKALIVRERVGQGTVTLCGLPPALFCSSPEWDAFLPSLLLSPPPEAPYMLCRRGPYVSLRVFPGGTCSLPGVYVDLTDPELAVREDPTFPGDTCAFVKDWSSFREAGAPRLIAASGHVEYLEEGEEGCRVLLQGPLGTTGALRFYVGDREAVVARAMDQSGQPVEVAVEREADTCLLSFPHAPMGVAVRVEHR